MNKSIHNHSVIKRRWLHFHNTSSLFSQHQNRKLLYFIHNHRVSKSWGYVCIPILVEMNALRPLSIHFAISSTLFILIENFQKTFFLIQFDSKLSIIPQETTQLGRHSLLSLLIDLHYHITQLNMIFLQYSINLEWIGCKLKRFLWGYSWKMIDICKRKLREIQLQIYFIEMDQYCCFGRQFDFYLCLIISNTCIEQRLLLLSYLL